MYWRVVRVAVFIGFSAARQAAAQAGDASHPCSLVTAAQISAAVALSAGVTAHESMQLDVRKGTIVRIDVKGLPKTLRAQPRWWMKPKKRALVKGLPLRQPKAPKSKSKAAKTEAIAKT